MRCIQQDKGLDQGQGQGQDSKVLKQDLGSTEAPLASRTHLLPPTILTDTHSGCRLMCEKHIHTLFGSLCAAPVLITHKETLKLKKKQNKQNPTFLYINLNLFSVSITTSAWNLVTFLNQ